MTGGDEIGSDLGAAIAAAIVIEVGDADPLDRGMARRHLAAEQSDAAGADYGEADALRALPHTFSPARFFCLSSAMPEIVSLVSGRSIGSLRSAERSPGRWGSITRRALSGVTMTAVPRMQASRKWMVSGPMPPA